MLFMAEDGADGSNENLVHRSVEIISRAIRRSLWLKINSLSKRYSMMKMEILCFVKFTVRREKKHRSSRIWLILAMPGAPRNCGGTVSFDHFWSKVIVFIEHRGQLIFERIHLWSRITCLSTVCICPKLDTPFLMESV